MIESLPLSQQLFPTSAVRHIQPRARRIQRRIQNIIMLGLTGALTLVALIPLFWIVGYVILKGAPALNWAFISQTPRPMGMEGGGVLHAIEGTVLLAVLATLFALPPGLLSAFYAAYHPNTPLGTALRFGTDVLSGVPSIVIGLFGYALLVKPVGHYSALAGGVSLALIMLPTIIRTTEEMIKLVPQSLREGALALGSPEWKTALQVTLPAALNGIITGLMLGIARAAGETAPLLFTALGNDRFDIGRMVTQGLNAGQSIFQVLWNIIQQPVDSLPLTLFKYSQQPFPERISQSWGVALVLILIVFVANITARLWVQRRTKQLRGS
jgi:phosphate transport system permease protein